MKCGVGGTAGDSWWACTTDDCVYAGAVGPHTTRVVLVISAHSMLKTSSLWVGELGCTQPGTFHHCLSEGSVCDLVRSCVLASIRRRIHHKSCVHASVGSNLVHGPSSRCSSSLTRCVCTPRWTTLPSCERRSQVQRRQAGESASYAS